VNDPKEIVRAGYDAIAARYAKWAASFESPEAEWIEAFLARLEPGSRVLDLGCGGGRTSARAVAARHDYTGVDISPAQVARARERIPSGRFHTADVLEVELKPESFDGVMSLFMLGHVPRAEQGAVLTRMRGWLRPGGTLLATLGTDGSDDEIEDDWLGAPMFFASFPPEQNRRLLAEAGLDVVRERVVEHVEPGHGPVSFMWVLAAAGSA
jgi:cyclopropane fatty-acyl-phospholipid synthase-like methyltransferase